jgi:pimeloyl-ACP methyl ester carboxylesterase
VLVEDVHRLLHSSAGLVPCIYVGQSFGGLMARLYAHRHPQDVAAVVLVDSFSEEQFDACGPLFPPPAPGEPAMLTGMRAFWQGGWRDPSQNKEGIDMLACQAAGRAIGSLGDMPLRVLTASSFVYPPLFPPEYGTRLQKVWEDLQQRFTRLSSRASQQVVAECGHFMQKDKPQVVADAIGEVVRSIAAG